MENCITTSLVLVCLVIAVNGYLYHATNDQMFIVLMTTNETETSLVLQDMYCLDPVVPATEEECNYRVLAPVDGYFTNTNIIGMSIGFEHPSHGTNCRINWQLETEDVELTCDNHHCWYYRLPAFRAVISTSGTVTVETDDEYMCSNQVSRAWYYKFGLPGYSEQRPTAVFPFEEGECTPFSVTEGDSEGDIIMEFGGGFIIGRRDRSWTTLNNCVYDKRRRCRPVKSD